MKVDKLKVMIEVMKMPMEKITWLRDFCNWWLKQSKEPSK